MKQFALAKYATQKDMYLAKANYYEQLCWQLVNYLHDTEDIRMNIDTGDYYWVCSGEVIGKDI